MSSIGPMFINREPELQELRALSRRAPALALLYGRRRLGKTFLLDHAWSDQRRFYFLAADTTSEMNRSELLRELSAWTGTEYLLEDFPSWRNIFRAFVAQAESGPIVVVLDEFQYLMEQPDDLVSQMVAIWDREVRDRPLMLVLCGSEVAMMESLEAGDAPLYGRPNWSARIRPFDYWNASRMVPNRSPREAAYVYGVFGGTPRFLATISGTDVLADRIIETIVSPRGEVHLQLERLIEQEKGIREPREYRAVLSAVADGHTDTERIAAAAGLEDRKHVVIRALGVLADLELVSRERNFGASDRTPWQNRISDNAVRFWYRFVHKNRSLIETGHAKRVWAQRIEPNLDEYMGKVFEGICREAFLRQFTRWDLAAPLEWARWEGQDRNRRSIEIDIVSRLDDQRLLTGEINWSSRPVDIDVHLNHVHALEDLAHSGQAWAHEALNPKNSRIYFSAAGFTDHFRTRASAEGHIVLVDLAEIYAD